MRARTWLDDQLPIWRALCTGAVLLIAYAAVTLPIEWSALLTVRGQTRSSAQALAMLQGLLAGKPLGGEHRLVVFIACVAFTLLAALAVAGVSVASRDRLAGPSSDTFAVAIIAGALLLLTFPAHLPFLLPHVRELKPDGSVVTQAEYSRAWRDAITYVWSAVLLLAIPVLASGRIGLRLKAATAALSVLAVSAALLPHMAHRGSRTDNELVIFGAALLTVLYLGHQVHIALRHESHARQRAEQALETTRAERRRYEEQSQAAIAELGAMEDRLAVREAARAKFLAEAAHDLRHPLMAALIYADLAAMDLQQGQGHAQQADALSHLSVLRAEIGSLATAFDAILDYSHLENGRVTPHPQPSRLREIFGELDRRFSPLARQQQLDLCFVYPDDGYVVETDRVLFTRLLSNLVSNAIKCTPARTATQGRKGRHDVMVRAHRRGLMATVFVVDRGSGIPPDMLDAIFEAGVQLENPHGSRSDGFGLGLATVRSIVSRALTDHAVHLRSIPGRGTHFMVDVPLTFGVTTCLGGIEVPPVPSYFGNLDGALVAIVEDDESLRRGVTAVIRNAGAYVMEAGSLDEMAQRLSNADRLPDIVLTDFRLPGAGDGAAVIRAVRAACFGHEIPALVLTADPGAAEAALGGMPAVTVLRKPIDGKALLARLALHYSASSSPLARLAEGVRSSSATPARATS